MNALRLVVALVCIPRLFVSLLLFPLLISFSVIVAQIVFTGLFVQAIKVDEDPEERLAVRQERDLTRRILFPQGDIKDIIVCRWIVTHIDGLGRAEVPPSDECAPDRMDVAIQVPHPDLFATKVYEEIFQGYAERLHVCQLCTPDVVIKFANDSIHTELRSIWGLLILSLARYESELLQKQVRLNSTGGLSDSLGDISMHLDGFRSEISISNFHTSLAVVFNILVLIIITLWLALKGHRKVLDYFVQNGALLPMVSAIGKRPFYSALWLLTMLRVGCFLIAAVPISYISFRNMLSEEARHLFFHGSATIALLWLLATVASLTLAVLIASISDLKHRHDVMGFVYRYVPLVLSFLGFALWAFTFLLEGPAAYAPRALIASLPVVGITPVLLGPIFEPSSWIFLLHTFLSAILIILVIRHNAEWFSAHLEEM